MLLYIIISHINDLLVNKNTQQKFACHHLWDFFFASHFCRLNSPLEKFLLKNKSRKNKTKTKKKEKHFIIIVGSGLNVNIEGLLLYEAHQLKNRMGCWLLQ